MVESGGYNPALVKEDLRQQKMTQLRARVDMQPIRVTLPQRETRRPGEKMSYLKSKDRSVVGSEAFNLNFDEVPTREELYDNIVSYLGEYRLQVQKHQYELFYGRDRDRRGEITIRDKNRGESLVHKAKRSVEERTLKQLPKHREEAEVEGLNALNEQLRFAQTGDTVVWASPPGPEEQGYGDYGFIFAGKVTRLDNGEKKLAMTAIRVEKPKKADGMEGDPWIAQSAHVLNTLSGENTQFKTAEDLLATPKLIRADITDRQIDGVLQEAFDFAPNEQDKEKMEKIIKRMSPLIEEFITKIYTGTKAERIKAFYALENYALDLNKRYNAEPGENVVYMDDYRHEVPTLDQIVHTHGHKPPEVKGSCGLAGSGNSNGMTIMGGSSLVDMIYAPDSFEGRTFTCSECGKVNVRPSGKLLSKCQSCSSKKVAC